MTPADGDARTSPVRSPDSAAYGGAAWRARAASSLDEIGSIWRACGIDSEVLPLRSVLLHRPGAELSAIDDADAALMLALPDAARAARQHDALVSAYEREGIEVLLVEPGVEPPPNQMFVADLFFMTPAGAILGRPASAVRAGEERWVARRLADIGVPILRSIAGAGAFEGADAMWLDPRTVLLARGPRTNDAGAAQVAAALAELGVDVVRTELPAGTMHLMGQLRVVDDETALFWPGRLDDAALDALHRRGYRTHAIPDVGEADRNHALNMVTLVPRRVLMPAGNPRTERFLNELGIETVCVETDELHKAAGSIGCLTGVLHRA
jgi:arginine deiminase